jgi:hypothetical protein
VTTLCNFSPVGQEITFGKAIITRFLHRIIDDSACRLFDFTDTMYTYLFCRLPMPIPKILGYIENVVPQYSDEQFRRLFRMSGDKKHGNYSK